MDQADLDPLLVDLATDVSSLTQALSPLLSHPLSAMSSHLPLLDKAKIHILTTYAIESVLFSSLRLAGQDAKQHPVFTELARVRQYFEKVKLAEEGPAQRAHTIDKEAAGRFIKHGLAGNGRFDEEKKGDVERLKVLKRKADAMGPVRRKGTKQPKAFAAMAEGGGEGRESNEERFDICSSDELEDPSQASSSTSRRQLRIFPLAKGTKVEEVQKFVELAGFIVEQCKAATQGKNGNGASWIALVTFSSAAEARRAKVSLSGSEFHGKKIRAKLTQETSNTESTAATTVNITEPVTAADNERRRLLVKHTSRKKKSLANESKLRELFARKGFEVEFCCNCVDDEAQSPKGQALNISRFILQLSTAAQAQQAMDLLNGFTGFNTVPLEIEFENGTSRNN